MTETYYLNDPQFPTTIRALKHDSGQVTLKLEDCDFDESTIRLSNKEQEQLVDIMHTDDPEELSRYKEKE